jgi:PAS domain S-box-containing protein
MHDNNNSGENSNRLPLDELRQVLTGHGKNSFRESNCHQSHKTQTEVEKFHHLANRFAECIIVVRRDDQRVIDLNQSALRLLGYSRKDYLKLSLNDIIQIPDKNAESDSINSYKTIAPEKSFLYKKDGSTFIAEYTIDEVTFGKTRCLIIIARDITEYEKMHPLIRESEYHYRVTINSIPDEMVVVDSDLNIIICNTAFEKLTEKNGHNGEIVGSSLMKVAPYLTGKHGLEYKYIFRSGARLDTTLKIENGSKKKIYEVIKTPVEEKGSVGKVVTLLRDRTKHHELEDIKKEAFFQIEKNMEQFAILNDHIRNPLQAIVGLADLEGSDFSNKIIEQAREIDEIVKKLDSGWIDSDKVREMLIRHYGIKVHKRQNLSPPEISRNKGENPENQ